MQVAERLAREGWQVARGEDTLRAEREVIVSRWMLGSRIVRLGLECRFDAAAKVLYYRQSALESVKGLPPPTFSFTVSRQRGLHLNETRNDRSLPAGGGEMHYGDVATWMQALCDAAGWRLAERVT